MPSLKTPSITTWTRLEPRCRDAEMKNSLQARVYDPLWLLARQWQLGEFQGEDNGSPVLAHWRAAAAPLTRYHAGAIGPGATAASYDGSRMPLETLVEREAVQPTTSADALPDKLRLAAEAGQHFLRMLDQLLEDQTVSRSYRKVFRDKFPFPPLTPEQKGALDAESLGFLQVVGLRVPDGRRLYAELHPPPDGRVKLPADLAIHPADVAEVEKAAEEWLAWWDAFFSQPAASEPAKADQAWSAERMEYAFSVGARFGDGEQVLTAPEYYGGRLDWYAFDANPQAVLGAATDGRAKEIVSTAMPAPVSFRGMPAARFWEFEDAQVDFGAVDAGPTDLVRMLLVEFALSYGNDWFVVPVDLQVGSVCRTLSFIITDTFGVRTLIKPSSAPDAPDTKWRMFEHANLRRAEQGTEEAGTAQNLFFLPPALLKSLESRPIEEVQLLRDEVANLAWGVERLVESAAERPLNRFEAYLEQERQRTQESLPQPAATAEMLHYRLLSEVPDYWIPLMPVKTAKGLRLRRGAVLKTDGSQATVRAQGRILESSQQLSLFEEEVPREGIRVTRSYQFTRWVDGSSHLWIGRCKGAGRGGASSGLRFDSLNPNDQP